MTASAAQSEISFPLKDFAFAQQLHESAREFLPEIAGIIKKHGLEDEVAIRLLHTHFPLERGDALVHRRFGDVFETRPGRAGEGAVGCTFTPSQAGSGGLDIIEYVEDAQGGDPAGRMLARQAFIDEATAALSRNGMNTLYGLGARFYRDALDAGDNLILVERNDIDGRRSETRAMDRSVLDGETWTETAWRVAGDRLVAEGACITSGMMACERPPPPPPA